ncbi:glycoside hydrolase family 3 N-terminal domain-containing protein [Herbivorax sp. ANBcel31]|uniref:glycoside hydrolase family 3 N-terminal domain-containing protein n=1 Tax=Herbivorax sp. ANBcel31 TaxID=3069754 RepID=UPI0027B45C77|nr:glycoside hydrolase family 3 N-terminal domain-containing protein [Herbivorax sp. ANBcel31]MDQ2085503.1 glycoside hydrolase family 3 N-terminal domain-containing protein [Herbivorax sp. ANBcel31]
MNTIYNDPSKSPKERTKDLISKMTLEEKIGQMCQIDGNENPELWLKERNIGSFLHVIGDEAIRLQKMATEQTRLGIPLLFGIDAIHGHAFHSGATAFPSQLALSSSWNPQLVEKVGNITAKEVSLTGLHWTFSPVLCLARDIRWGRVDETFGEDPYLAGSLSASIIKGYQGKDLSHPESILACAKHFIAYGETQGARDASESDVSERKLRSIFLPPFKDAVDAGCATFMTAYQAIDGIPCSANKWLLKDVLKNELGFSGFVVTDWDNTGHMHRLQKTTSTIKEACEIAIKSGNDMIMATPEFFENAVELVREDVVSESLIDEACFRILETKFRLGLFDHKRYPDTKKYKIFMGCDEHRKAAYDAALESIVLLKNKNNTLPISNKFKKIAVIGPNANDPQAQLGDWSFGPRYYPERPTLEYNDYDISNIVTILDGIKKRANSSFEVFYEKGCDVIDEKDKNIKTSIETAEKSDVIVAVVGDTIVLNGETRDRVNLDLTGAQLELLKALKDTGKPLIVLLINGKPLTIPWIKENADAIVEAWNPGIEGGNAVSSILFGDYNPCGKLSISFPKSVGQQPVYYAQLPGWHGGSYADMEPEPLFHFGYGLSYTNFEYSNLKTSKKIINDSEDLIASVEIKNTGQIAGSEIAQLYTNDIYTSVTTPLKELKEFKKVFLTPGETKTIEFKLPLLSFSFVNRNCKRCVEPGEFEILVGSSSKDGNLLKTIVTYGGKVQEF